MITFISSHIKNFVFFANKAFKKALFWSLVWCTRNGDGDEPPPSSVKGTQTTHRARRSFVVHKIWPPPPIVLKRNRKVIKVHWSSTLCKEIGPCGLILRWSNKIVLLLKLIGVTVWEKCWRYRLSKIFGGRTLLPWNECVFFSQSRTGFITTSNLRATSLLGAIIIFSTRESVRNGKILQTNGEDHGFSLPNVVESLIRNGFTQFVVFFTFGIPLFFFRLTPLKMCLFTLFFSLAPCLHWWILSFCGANLWCCCESETQWWSNLCLDK